jgi:AcrR family transcriptional regulator
MDPQHDHPRRLVIRGEAIRQFHQYGFDATSLRDIGRALGAPDAPRHAFTDKPRLLQEIVEHHATALVAAVEAAVPQGLFAMARAYLLAAGAAREAHLVLLREARHLPDAARADLRARAAWVRLPLAEALAQAVPNATEAASDHAAWLLLSMLDSQVRALPRTKNLPEALAEASVHGAVASLRVLA